MARSANCEGRCRWKQISLPHPALPELWQWQDRGVQRSLSQLMWVSFKMPGKWLCWPHPHSEILFWELLTKLQPKEQELTHLYSTHALHSHTQMCPRCTWAGMKQANLTLCLRDPSLEFCLGTPVPSTKVCSHIFITAACHSLPASALLLLLLNTNLCSELKTASWAADRELSAVFYYLQLKLAMNKEIKINKLLCYYSLYVEQGKKKPLKQPYLLKWTWLYILCVNQLSPSWVLLQDKTVLKAKLEGPNKSFQHFQFTWQSSVHGKLERSEGSSVQDIYTTKHHLAAVSYV